MSLPAVPDTFYWVREPWGGALRCRPLEAIAPHLFSTRLLMPPPGEAEWPLGVALGSGRLVMVSQVHGAGVVVVRGSDALPSPGTRGDVLVTAVPGVALGVRTADCVPILIGDRSTGAVAAVHAGWRGTAAGATGAAVSALTREFGCRPPDLLAAIGPSIGACCYEVGSDVVDAFAASGYERYLIDRWFPAPPPPRGSRQRPPIRLDLAGANRDQLILAGVAPENVHISGLCTAEHLDALTSYRVEKSAAGRMVAAIAARPV